MSHRYDTSLKLSELKFQSGERVVSRSTDTRSFSYVFLSLICTYLTYYLLYIDCLLMSVNCSLVTFSCQISPVKFCKPDTNNLLFCSQFSKSNTNDLLPAFSLVDRFSVLFIIFFFYLILINTIH